jgi:hypothetical protein
MAPTHLDAAPQAPADPHAVPCHFRSGKLGQLGAIGEVHALLHQCPATGRAGIMRQLQVYWWLSDCLGRRGLPVAEGPRAGHPSRALRLGLSCTFGKGGGLSFAAPLELVDLGTQRLVAGGQLGHLTLQRSHLALQLSHPHEQLFSTQRGKRFGRTHGRQYSPPVRQPQARPLINYSCLLSLLEEATSRA